MNRGQLLCSSVTATALIDLSPTLEFPNPIMANEDDEAAGTNDVGEEDELLASLTAEDIVAAKDWVEAQYQRYYIG